MINTVIFRLLNDLETLGIWKCNTFASILNRENMSLNSIFQFLVPKDKVFHPLFELAVNKLQLLSETMHEAVNLPSKEREDKLKEVEELKSEIEDIAQTTRIELGKNFITPFDREDIHALISAIDDVADNLSDAASRMRLYHLNKVTKPLRKLTEANLEACTEIALTIKELKNLKNLDKIAESCKKIYKLERKADKVFDKALSDIFENEEDVRDVIRYKEVMAALESSTDSCRKVANVLEAITVKYS